VILDESRHRDAGPDAVNKHGSIAPNFHDHPRPSFLCVVEKRTRVSVFTILPFVELRRRAQCSAISASGIYRRDHRAAEKMLARVERPLGWPVVGQRSRTASVAAVMGAFFSRRSWTQAELGRAVDLSSEALRNVLRELRDSGIPLESEKDHPHVYWRMAKDWYPGGVLFKAEDVPQLLRHLSHLPRSKARDRLLAIVTEQLPARGKLAATPPLVSRPSSESEEQYLPTIEEAAAKRVPLFMKYLTASRGGRPSERHVSVHVIEVGPPARFIATCHRNSDLRWFRVDGIVRARLDDGQKFRDCEPDDVAAFRESSLDGFKGPGPVVGCSFLVREPESAWVANNLLEGMHVESAHGGIRVGVQTSALVPLARFVVRLGDAARPETPALAQVVVELARGALEQAEAALGEEKNSHASKHLERAPARPRSDV
jgi:predicted DNA-binding transcriptional regulator YafY